MVPDPGLPIERGPVPAMPAWAVITEEFTRRIGPSTETTTNPGSRRDHRKNKGRFGDVLEDMQKEYPEAYGAWLEVNHGRPCALVALRWNRYVKRRQPLITDSAIDTVFYSYSVDFLRLAMSTFSS